MTKSGIGTMTGATPTTHQQQNTNTNNSSSALISKTEIPIWVSDRKKWVTGINKRTTINDLIFAVLKQCQVINSSMNAAAASAKGQSKSNQSGNGEQSANSNANIMEHIAGLYVLAEYHLEQMSTSSNNESVNTSNNGVQASYRILENDSKVYKYFSKWLQSPSSYMLKILQRQPTDG
jgi:hypothetical protein